MKKTLAVSFGAFALALAGIGGWYWQHTHSSDSEAHAFEQDAKNRKLIPVEFEVTPPPETPPDQFVYLSGSEPALGNWEAAGVRLDRGDDGKYRGKVEITSGIEYAFKLTRGTWSTVEKGPNGEEIPDRTLRCDAPQKVAVTVASWVDGGKAIPTRVSLSGDIRLHKKFQSSILNNERTLVVYVPPGYDQSGEQRYPVLYMQDGQNLFDEQTSYAGVEWRLDEAAQRLIGDQQIRPVIIVGIYNTPDRTPEFTPPPAGRADKYADFIVEEVKPFIDKVYRTQPDRGNTAIGGSSMGGMVSLWTAKEHPQTFSHVAVLTPFLRVEGKPLTDLLGSDASWLKGMRVWIDMSPSPKKYYPGDDPTGDARAFVKVLDGAGLKKDVDYKYVELDEGEHTEASWQTRADQVLMFLYGTNASPTTSPTASAK
jgi:predicted alpha/beta superfamily hydrolase